ncbi:MAG: response regulator transcription factor [Chitinophagaceae bacterium]
MRTKLTDNEAFQISNQQVFTLESKIRSLAFSIDEIGDYLPGHVLVTDLSSLTTEYMNKSGCNILMHSVAELAAQGPEYFSRFFVKEEMEVILPRYLEIYKKQDTTAVYNFVHRAKPIRDRYYKWYFASAKLQQMPGKKKSDKLLVIVNEVKSAGDMAKKISHVLDESEWMKKNFRKFCTLTRREKDIISLLANGKSGTEISEKLLISRLTVNTHRRNIIAKLETKNFAELYKFATGFGLIE